MKTLHKIIKRAGAVLLHNEVANMKLQQLFEQVVAQNPPFATTLIFNLYEDSARFTVEAVLDDEAVVIGRDMFSGMAFNQAERNAAKATQSLFTKVGAWGARWGSNGFEEITNYYSQVTCSYAVIKGIRVGVLKSVLYDGVYSIFSTMKTKIDNLPR